MKRLLNVLLAFVLIFAGMVFAQPEQAKAAASNILITEIYYDTHVSSEPDEYVAISNPLSYPVDISGWSIGTSSQRVYFPSSTTINGGETFYIAREADIFIQQNIVSNVEPNFKFTADSAAHIPMMVISGATPRFANNGGEVFLKDDSSVIIDAVAYGNSTYSGTGWTGPSVPGVSAGVILVRDKTEATGDWEDTDSAADFDDLRVYQQGQSRFDVPTIEYTGSVQTYTSPDSSYGVLTDLMNSAQYSLDLNLYEFQNPYLLDTLIDAIDRGVQVRTFFEGSPVGGLHEQSKYVSQQIVEAGGEVRYIMLDRSNNRHKRYRFDHAKYLIVDGEKVAIQSENWKKTGVPTDNSAGNRGWGIVINNVDFADYFQNVFNADWNPANPDSFPYTPGHPTYGEPSASFVLDDEIPLGSYPALFPSQTITGNFKVTPIVTPDASFKMETSIIGMIRGAQDFLYLDQLYAHKHWGSQSGTPATNPNIYLEEVIEAARRGVSVKVSLGDAFIDPNDSRDNSHTVAYLNSIAASEGLDMEAKLLDTANTKLEKTHNKGIIADNKVLVSSINWSSNSPTNNREAGVIVENADVANFYKDVFLWDWAGGSAASALVETFETGSKTGYAAANINLASGQWYFDEALMGSLANDKKNGNRSVRMKANASIHMNYDVAGAVSVSFLHANYGTDSGGVIQLQKSTDGGLTWTSVGSSFTSGATLTEKSYVINETGNVRFKIVVTGSSGARINIDDFKIFQ